MSDSGIGRILVTGRVSYQGLEKGWTGSTLRQQPHFEFYICIAPRVGYRVFTYDKKLFERLSNEILPNTHLTLEGELYLNNKRSQPRLEIRLLMWKLL